MNRLRNPAFVLGIAALTLRLGWVLVTNARTGAELRYPDESLHWQIATHVATRGEFRTDDGRQVARMPLYPLFLAPFAQFGEAGIPAARIAQAVLSTLVVVVGARFATAALGDRAAWLAGVLLTFDPYAVFFSSLLLTEIPFSLAAICLVYLGWRLWVAAAVAVVPTALAQKYCTPSEQGGTGVPPVRILKNGRDARTTQVKYSATVARHYSNEDQHRHLSLLVGLAAAACLMLRQSSVGWIALFLVVIALAHANRRLGLERLVGQVLIITAAMLPWGIRNQVSVGSFAWLSANGGVTLYDAQGPQADGSSDQRFLAAMPELSALTEIEQDALLTRYAIDAMKSDKWRVAALAWNKFTRTWNPSPNADGHRTGFDAWASALFTITVLLLAILAWIRSETARRNASSGRAAVRFLILPVVLFTLLHCIYIGSVRYRAPLMPLLAIAAGAALQRAPARR